MHRLLLIPLLIASTFAVGQNNSTDSQTLRSMLEEIRQLRQDLKTTTVASQRIQIALYRLQLQEAAVLRAAKLVEEAHSKLAELAAERKRVTSDIEQFEDLHSRTQDAQHRKVIEDEVLPQLKKHLERISQDEGQWQAKSGDAESQLKTEQTKVETLNNLLDELDRVLQNVGRNPVSSPSSD